MAEGALDGVGSGSVGGIGETVSAAGGGAARHVHFDYDATLLDRLPGLSFFSNGGNYVPRTHCMQTAAGGPDWLWIAILIGATVGVVVFYTRIFLFWRKAYVAEAPGDRNPRMMQLARIFFWCAICGYVMSVCMFFWPAYRLLAVFLVVLNVWSWRFVLGIKDFGIALRANRLQRELQESLSLRNAELEREVEERTRELERARRVADEANAAKSSFLANMSHEIRTPMTAILGYTELLGDGSVDEATREEYLSTVSRNGEHLLGIINDVLDLSKIEAGRMTVERIECSPASVLAEVESLLRPRASSKNVKLRMELSGSIPSAVRSDPLRLRQVLINLVGNAIKFTELGEVRVAARYESDAGLLRFVVEDTGIGMTAEQLSGLFTPFQQADASMSRRFGGTGLGLTISKRLAEQLGGALTAESWEGLGSRFTLTVSAEGASSETVSSLCEAPRAASGRPEHFSGDVPLEGVRVLLVEDGPDNQRLVSHHLRKAGAAVTLASNGAEAVAALTGGGLGEGLGEGSEEGGEFDLVLMDMQMPVMDGYTAASVLRSEHGYGSPIVALTAHAMSHDREKCLRAGCDDFVTKPIDVAGLIGTCRMWAERGRTGWEPERRAA